MELDYFQMIRTWVPDEYKVKVSFNGPPTINTSDLVYDGPGKRYTAYNVLAGNITLVHAASGTSHLQGYAADEAIGVHDDTANHLCGKGIIKTTHYPPPYNKNKKYTYENSAILKEVFLNELTIERDASGNFMISGKVKQIPGQTATFNLKFGVRLVQGKHGRPSEILEICLEPGSETELPFSVVQLNNNDNGNDKPCSVIIHAGNQLDFTKYYEKSAWFYMED